MQLTEEQLSIIQSDGNIKINAVAGSGKTSTLIEYAKSRLSKSRILYLAFNKSVKMEASKKFSECGLKHVRVETPHSLAYNFIVKGSNYKLKPTGYKTYEIVEALGLNFSREKHAEYIAASHILKLVSLFCNSDQPKIKAVNYLDTLPSGKAKAFATAAFDYIEKQSRILLAKMDKAEIEITHDFYLKKFQLSNPVLNYDYILFDEGQDASSAMLDVFLKQKAVKIIVGDTHQQIYGWRYAVNSLEKVNFPDYALSSSFRFGEDIASLAVDILERKNEVRPHAPFLIKGRGESSEIKSKAIIGRSNLGLLFKAIELVIEEKAAKSVYFEGNVNSYTYAEDGASLYDVLSLQNGRHQGIRSPLIKQMRNLSELEEYIEKTADIELGTMLELVNEYGNDIPEIIKEIKALHVPDEDREKADYIFSTVHRAKGMEYDSVELVGDFLTEEKLKELVSASDDTTHDKLIEEVNLLYVAVTRTKSILRIPESLLPKEFKASATIIPLKAQINALEVVEETEKEGKKGIGYPKPRAYTVEEKRQKNKDAYRPWTEEADEDLTIRYCKGEHVKDLASYFGRTRGAIVSRIKKLDLENLYS